MSIRDRVRPGLRGLSPYHVAPHDCEVKLDANESPHPLPPSLMEAISVAVRSARLERYPDPRAGKLRALVAADLGQPEDRLVFGNGSDDLIGLLCQTFAAPRSDGSPGAVVYPAPSFVVYRTAAYASGLDVVEVPLGPRFAADPVALDETLAAVRPNLVFIATPNNPTGTLWPRAALEACVAKHPDTVFVIDEAYAAYAGETCLDLVEKAENCLVLRTYSKVGLAALRLGVLVAQPAIAHEVEKARPPYNLGALPQLAGELCLGPFRDQLDRHLLDVMVERERLRTALSALDGVEVFPSSANLLLLRVRDAGAVFASLLARSVLVRNLDRPGPLRNCLRVTVGTHEENTRFLAAFTAALAPG